VGLAGGVVFGGSGLWGCVVLWSCGVVRVALALATWAVIRGFPGVFHVKTSDSLVSVVGRLGELQARYGLSRFQRDQLEAILRGLAGAKWAPTGIRDPSRAVDVHIADSLVALELDVLAGAQRIADIGAGAGFPGLILAVALPSSKVSLIESQARKCVFIEGLRTLGEVANGRAICTRVEDWAAGVGGNDVVLARALAPQAVVVEYAAPLLCEGGSLVDWRGRRDAAEERAGATAAGVLGLERTEIRRVEPYRTARGHHIHVYVKTRPTPEGFPRRVGQARKRPLGG
jgi:16S rRNA (guanine527-N7)-methyltransferase